MSSSGDTEARVSVSSTESGSRLLAVVVDLSESFSTSLQLENPSESVSFDYEICFSGVTAKILAVVCASMFGLSCDIL